MSTLKDYPVSFFFLLFIIFCISYINISFNVIWWTYSPIVCRFLSTWRQRNIFMFWMKKRFENGLSWYVWWIGMLSKVSISFTTKILKCSLEFLKACNYLVEGGGVYFQNRLHFEVSKILNACQDMQQYILNKAEKIVYLSKKKIILFKYKF